MKLYNLIAKGYFPKELPPPFTTKGLAEKYDTIKGSILGATDKNPTRCLNYSISKVGIIRKLLKIPNPMHQLPLCNDIVDNWEEIENFIKESKLSFSRPKLTGPRAANISPFKEFKKRVFLSSYSYAYELKTDISKYFPSIYTHSIPWALVGKSIAKTLPFRHDKTHLGNKLDIGVQQTMYGQTIGLPIGPDSSLIISEILGCSIDKHLIESLPDIKGYRYVDDMHLFFHSYAEAENGFLELQKALKEFELQVNTEKTEIRKLPQGFDKEWSLKLRHFKFRETPGKQHNDIISFFGIAFELANLSPNEYILSYAVSRVKYLKLLNDENFLLLETMLLKTMVAEPSTIKEVFRILFTYKEKIKMGKIEKVLFNFLEYHSLRASDYEVSWALWMARTFNIKIPHKTSEILSKSDDTISILIMLDMKSIDLIDINTDNWEKKLDKASLMDENWLLAYEVAMKKWIRKKHDYIKDVPFFKILKTNKVSFYNSELQIEKILFNEDTINVPQPEEVDTAQTINEGLGISQTNEEEIVYNLNEDVIDADFFYEYNPDDDWDILNLY